MLIIKLDHEDLTYVEQNRIDAVMTSYKRLAEILEDGLPVACNDEILAGVALLREIQRLKVPRE